MDRRLMSLRTRILIVIVGVILAVFASIMLIFNVLMNNYISRTVTTQLSSAVALQPIPPLRQEGQGRPQIEIPDLSNTPASRFNTHPLVFGMDDSYSVIAFAGSASSQEGQAALAIGKVLKSRHIDLNTLRGRRVHTSSGVYYVQSKKQRDTATGAHYLVFYVDVTGIVNFATRINLFLIIIMMAAIIITFFVTFFITRRMIRPLADLTAFSTRIGHGDFTPCTEEFHDRELATLAASMNHTATQLGSYDNDQKTFFQNASHELRTPLMSIKCYAEGIAYDVMDAKKASETILSETDRLSGMVEDLLTVSRIDNITQSQRTAVCDLRELVSAAADEQRAVAERKHLELKFVFDEAPVTLWANDKTLQRAFSNLISNALRYARSRVVLSCRQEAGQAVITVADDGPGIAADLRPHIFERFSKGADGNHGIGLSIVKSVVEQHEGAIEVSTSEAGTTFTLTFEAGKDERRSPQLSA